VARGQAEAELAAAAEQADLIALGKGLRLLACEAKWAFTARAIAARPHLSILLAIRAEASPDRPVAVMYDGSAAADQALGTAAKLVARDGRRLVVLVTKPPADDWTAREQLVLAKLRGPGVPALLRRISGSNLEEIVRVLRAERAGLFIVRPEMFPTSDEHWLGEVVEKGGCPVLLIRP
jgi:hypothetical protein